MFPKRLLDTKVLDTATFVGWIHLSFSVACQIKIQVLESQGTDNIVRSHF